MRCAHCHWKYPDSYLHPIHGNDGQSRPVCGICALEAINKAHGIRRDKFDGEQAELNRLSAIAWRKNHPNDAPSRS